MENNLKYIVDTIITDIVNNAIQKCENIDLIRKFKKDSIFQKFNDEIQGYHLICEAPIKESLWEEINKNIASVECIIKDEAKGNHKSGKDMQFDEYGISMKSAKIDKNKISISSYRLTTTCSDKNPGIPENIVSEINLRDSSFQYYSVLLREESNNIIKYYWCLIPKKCKVFNISSNDFKPKIGKNGKNKGIQVGWETQHSCIQFSMSSQLWIHFTFDDIKQYIITSTIVDNSKKKNSYSDIYNILNRT
jgi:hypothetical protein